jgi:hypothetical protein
VREVHLQLCDELTDVSALAPLQDVGGLSFTESGVQSFRELRLQSADSITFRYNSSLRDLDGLSSLISVHYLAIEDNESLVRIELPALRENSFMSIKNNDALDAVPGYSLNRGYAALSDSSAFGGVPRSVAKLGFEVGDNAELTSVAAPMDAASVQDVWIYSNPKLTTLDLGGIPAADRLLIRDNPALHQVDISAPFPGPPQGLTRVGELEVIDNPALSTAVFDDLQTFTRTFSGNLDEPAP